MFSCVIARWVNLANFSRNAAIRSGVHDRASEWPLLLVQAESDRVAFDTTMCLTTGAALTHNEERHLAFAMAMHSRLGMNSEAHGLVGDLVRQISLSSMHATTTGELYNDFLHAREVATPAGQHHQLQSFAYSGIQVHVPRETLCCDVRRMSQSEYNRQPAHVWPGRTGYFFCRRGWFVGVHPRYTPHDINTNANVVLSGVFESIPHIFCDIWFPRCWPFERCMHLVHITFAIPPPATVMDEA